MDPKRCLVLGGSGVVGRAVCQALHEQGARLVFTYHDREDAARDLAASLAGARSLRLDLANVADVEHGIDQAVELLGGLEALVQCAGLASTLPAGSAPARQPMATIDEAAWDRMLAVNLKGVFFACRRAVPVMAGQGGNVVLVGSFDAVRPAPGPVHHAASRAALTGLVSAMAKEVGALGVKVNVVAPGLLAEGQSRTVPEDLRKEFLKHSCLKRFGRPAEPAALIAWLALHNTYLTGQTLVVDGGL